MNVVYNTSVDAVQYIEDKRHGQGIRLKITNRLTNVTTTSHFDFCILDVREPMAIISNPSHLQKWTLSKYNRFQPAVTTIYQMSKGFDHYGTLGMFDDFEDFYGYEGCMGGATTGWIYSEERTSEKNMDTVVTVYTYCTVPGNKTYHSSKDLPSIDSLENVQDIALHRFQSITNNRKILKKLHTETFYKYYPHFSAENLINGVPWELFRLQGDRKMWFVGGLPTFDTTDSILQYNMKLLAQYKL